MDTRTATVIIRFKTTDGTWKRATAARGANGRIRPGYALVDGEQVKVSDEHRYQVRYYDRRELKYQSVDGGSSIADTVARQIEQRMTALSVAREANLQVVEEDNGRKTLAKSAKEYVGDAEERDALEAAIQAKSVTEEFAKVTKRVYMDEITRGDVLQFHKALRKRKCSDRTVANKHARLYSWFRFAGLDAKKQGFPPAPDYEEKLPTIYERDEISSLLGEADEYLTMVILTAWKTGLRDQELMHLEFADIDWRESTLRVRAKPQWGFKVKDKEQRDVPIPADVLHVLKVWEQKRAGKSLVLGTEADRPNDKMLRSLKRLAKRAGLNCKRCTGCKSVNNECREFTLHKFRRTYITTMLRRGFDLRTVQAYAGHADLASTMRYLRPASASTVHERLNAMEW